MRFHAAGTGGFLLQQQQKELARDTGMVKVSRAVTEQSDVHSEQVLCQN